MRTPYCGNKTLFIYLFGFALIFPLFGQSQWTAPPTHKKNITYELSGVFAVGGESKLAIFLPKLNFTRKHKGATLNQYYGVEGGFYPLFVAGCGSIGVLYGVELNALNLETTLTHFRTTKFNDGANNYTRPFSQNLASLKMGFRIYNFRLKAVCAFALSESVPGGQERVSILDIGRVNNLFLGVEAQIYFM